MQHKLQRVGLRPLLVGRQHSGHRLRDRESGCVIWRGQMQDIETALSSLHPLRRRMVIGERWPHTPHLWREMKSKRHRTNRLDLIKRQRPSAIRRMLWRE